MTIVRMFMAADATPSTGQGASGVRRKYSAIMNGFRRRAARMCYVPAFMLHDADRGEWADALERGRIVHFARCPIPLPAAEDQDFLRQGLVPFLQRKNVSYYP